jgi:hypothetical protein
VPVVAAIPAIVGAAGAIGGAALSSRASNKASDATLAASNRASDVQEEANNQAAAAAKDTQDYERWLQSATSTARQPYLDALSQALGAGGGGGYSPTPYQAPVDPGAAKFVAPTQAQAESDPGYQFALSQGQQGIEHGASARGTLLTGGTLKDISQFNQNAASQQYDKVYGRAYGEAQMTEQERQAAFDRNAQNSFNAASLNNQSAYNAASLGLQGYGQRLSALGTLAGLATPGAYPGSAHAASTGASNVPYPQTALPNYAGGGTASGYGGEPGPSLGNPTSSLNNLGPNQQDPSTLPYGQYSGGLGYTPSTLGRPTY